MAVGKTGYTDVNIMNPDVATQLICRIRVYWREDYYTSGGYSTITITDIQGFVMHRVGFTNVKLSVKADNTTIYDCTSSVLWHFYSNEDSTLRPVYEYTNWDYSESCRFKAVTSSPIYHNSDGSKTINLTVNVANVSVSTYSASNQSATSSIICTPTHTHSYTSVVTAPTCTEQGYTTHTCSCGSSYIDTYVDALGHSYTSSVTKEPTCVEDGVRTYTCSRCNDSYTETIAATGSHNYVDNVCTVCGSSSVIPLRRICYIHNGTEWVKHIVCVSDKRAQCYIYKNINPESAMLG